MSGSSHRSNISNDPVAALVGFVGAGKTTLFNKVCDANRQAEITDDSCTRQFAKKKVFYDGRAMELYDGPGCNSKEDVYTHSYVLKEGLTFEPLNGIFVACTYDPRIRNNMGGSFYETAKMLKPEYFDLVVLLVTKMDQFKPDSNFRTRVDMEEHIKKTFSDEYGIDRVIFSHSHSQPREVFDSMYEAIKGRPSMQLAYTDEEFMLYFDMKAWKGREQFDLHRLKKQIEKLCGEYEEGLRHLVKNKSTFSKDDFQDYVYSMIQQNRVELDESIYSNFIKRNGDDQVAFEDYAASIELQKLIHRAHDEFRTEAKKQLDVNPDNHSDWRNAIRRCQHCREVWVKVEGCDGRTTCGARPSSGDAKGPDSYFRKVWERIDGFLRPGKFLVSRPDGASTLPKPRKENPIGCGGAIEWKDQAIVPKSELDCLFSTQELENILSSFKMESRFRHLKRKKERKIKVFSKLNDCGEDVDMEDAHAGEVIDKESDGEIDGERDERTKLLGERCKGHGYAQP